MTAENTAWQLEDFVDSLVVELDKTRETLAVKAINKPLSYTVKELALDLNIFPSYDGDQVRFVTAGPGEQGASKVTIQLGSITDQQVRATSKLPPARTDPTLQEIGLDPKTEKRLRRLGVSSVGDLEQLQDKDVDIKRVSDSDIDYSGLAERIRSSRRNQTPPLITAVSLSDDGDGGPCLVVEGRHLATDPSFPPVAVINEVLADVLSTSDTELRLRLGAGHRLAATNEVILTLDPYSLVRVNVRA